MTLVSPGIEASFENPRAAFLGFYTFDMQRSFDHPALNELEARRHALIDSHYRRSEKLSFALIGRYDLTQTAGDLSFNTGLLFDRHQALRWELNPSLAYQLSPRTTINALYDRTTERIVGETSAFEDIARVTVTRQKTPRTSFGLGYSVRHFINGDETHTSNAILFGSTYALTPATTFSMAGRTTLVVAQHARAGHHGDLRASRGQRDRILRSTSGVANRSFSACSVRLKSSARPAG